MNRDQIIAAQVILRPAGGKEPGPPEAITSENIRAFAPSAEAVDRVPRYFRSLGFEVGPVVGNSFSITGPLFAFEESFGVALRATERGGLKVVGKPGSSEIELPLNALPSGLGDLVTAVTFTEPPDFGPTGFR